MVHLRNIGIGGLYVGASFINFWLGEYIGMGWTHIGPTLVSSMCRHGSKDPHWREQKSAINFIGGVLSKVVFCVLVLVEECVTNLLYL